MTANVATSDPTVVQAPATREKKEAPTRNAPSSGGGAVYALGMIGAAVFFLGVAKSGPERILALGKAVVWPALLVYLAFKKLAV